MSTHDASSLHLLVGEETSQMRLAEDTRKQYRLSLARMVKWFKEKKPEFVNGNELKLPIPPPILQEFFYHAMLKVDSEGNYLDPPEFYSYNNVSAYRNALKDYYREREMSLDHATEIMLKNVMAAYRRRIAEQKAKGKMSHIEGRQPMSSAGFHFTAEQALKQTEDFSLYIMCHCFVILCWNLIARAVTVGNILFDAISWEGDSLTIHIGKMKNDQEGAHAFARHVYANPKDPVVCPVLSLAVLVFTKGYQREGSCAYVFGATGKDRFSSWLTNMLISCKDAILSLGLMIAELGSHSFRKGIATALANNPGGPEAINIWLRAGWSLGPVQSRYIFAGSGGDQFVGRAATGLSTNDPDFAILPPHFDVSNGPVLSVEEWEDILPGYSTFYPDSFRVALPYLLASLAYHRDWLDSNLSSQHPLFSQRVWTCGILQRLKSKVMTGIFYNHTSKMTATGVPPYVVLGNRMTSMETSNKERWDEVLMEIKAVPRSAAKEILEHCQVNGAVPVSGRQIEEMMENMSERLLGKMQDMVHSDEDRCDSRTARSEVEMSTPCRTWTWGGRFHMVPEGFRLPRCNVGTWWNLYWGGRPSEGYHPYRLMRPWDLSVRADRIALSKAKSVIDCLLTVVKDEVTTSDIESMRPRERDYWFVKSFAGLCGIVMGVAGVTSVEALDKKCVGEMSYTTLYDYLRMSRKRKA
eukprot:CAMPEP_0114439124 /NCGR_PEP_ID=MMETSP0103-20121206/15022_1 /TAXON_ID=37642 ORGANISM="Paraphysomonas imperforata, Strain PA2" /NCGR_SAMPLE_ID=MMETSP0103 /ASSEMBLY_ACC=CAM_ASM_000201 /LENGTH=694 /DNA_ID=CAMNT_0001609847 /DNA_START=28 /DNA_END=2109 /DNA_ORIENTATION=-